MSSRYYSRRPRTLISRKSKLSNGADESSSHSAATSGERAWDYLLRRKTEHITDRIYNRKGGEFEEEKTEDFSNCARKFKKEKIESDEDLPLHMNHQENSDSRNYSSSRGFWNDAAGEWLKKEMPIRVKTEFNDCHTMTARSHYCEREATTVRERRHESQRASGLNYDTAEEWLNKEMLVCVKTEFDDDHDTMTARSQYCGRETTTLRERRHESQHASDLDYTLKLSCERNLPHDDEPRDLIANVSNYIEDARRATKCRGSCTSAVTNNGLRHCTETHQPVNESCVRNFSDQNLIHIPKDGYPVQNYRRNSADRMLYDGSYENYQSFGQALCHNASNYAKDRYGDMNQIHRRLMANDTLSHNRPNYDDNENSTYLGKRQSQGRHNPEDMLFHNRQSDNEDAYPESQQFPRAHMSDERLHHNCPINDDDSSYCPVIQTCVGITPNEALYHNQLCNDEATYNATGPSNGRYETLYYNRTKGSYPSEEQSNERHMPDETLFHNSPNSTVEDLRHLLNSKSREKTPAESDLPFDPLLLHKTKDSVEDTCLPAKQSGKKDNQVTTGNRTLFHSLPYPAEGVEVVYTADSFEADAWLRNNVIDCDVPAVGFDIEWKAQFVSKKKGGKDHKTAVLQLAVENSCLVLHLHQMETLPNYLTFVLTDTKILKVGSGILQDVTKLKRDTRMKCIGLMDTQTMAKSVGVPAGSKLGLEALADRFLGVHLSKPKSIIISNWEKFPLTIHQINYAALDAWIGLKIYQHMKSMSDAGTTMAKPVEVTPCHVCNKKVKGKVALQQHIKTVHAGNESAQTTKTTPVRKICCHVCNKKVKDDIALLQHLNKVHAKCKCGKFFQDKVSKTHKRDCPALKADKKTSPKVSSSASVEKEGPGPNVCEGCGKKCRTTENLIEHIRDVGHVSCPFCTRLLHSVSSYSHIQKCRQFLGGKWKELLTVQVSSTASA